MYVCIVVVVVLRVCDVFVFVAGVVLCCHVYGVLSSIIVCCARLFFCVCGIRDCIDGVFFFSVLVCVYWCVCCWRLLFVI